MTDHPPDIRRRRLLYRATHRGTKEADLIIGGFFTANAAQLTDARLTEAERFLELSDLDLIDWIMGRKPVPDDLQGSIIDEVIAWERRRRRGP